jgi:hypothetical protein
MPAVTHAPVHPRSHGPPSNPWIREELSGLSARKAAEELNRRGIPTATGRRWFAPQVIRVRERLAS